jgi:heme A synthase
VDQTRPVALGPLLAGLAGLVLLGSLFVDWYERGLTAWTAFEVLDLVLAALALATIGVAAQSLGLLKARLPEGLLLGVAAAALVIVVSQLINHPPRALARDTDVGIWLALGASLLLLAGAALGSSYVSVVRVEEGPRRDAPPTTPAAGEEPTQPIPPTDPGRPA